jgi:hypothetical protein
VDHSTNVVDGNQLTGVPVAELGEGRPCAGQSAGSDQNVDVVVAALPRAVIEQPRERGALQQEPVGVLTGEGLEEAPGGRIELSREVGVFRSEPERELLEGSVAATGRQGFRRAP